MMPKRYISGALLFLSVFFYIEGRVYAGYSRIVSLAPSITSCLHDLNSQDKIVGVTSYCKAEGKDVVGTLIHPNIEKIVSLKPDLVLAAREWSSPATIEKLRSTGLNVVAFEPSRNFDEICDNFLKLANLVEKKRLAQDIVSDVKKQVDAIKLNVKGLPQKKVLWQVNARPLIAVGEYAFEADLIRFSGGVNIFYDIKRTYSTVSYEEAVRRDPHVIILVTMGDVTQDEVRHWFEFKNLSAVRQNRVFVVDANKICQPTPFKFAEGLKKIAGLVHPEILEIGTGSR